MHLKYTPRDRIQNNAIPINAENIITSYHFQYSCFLLFTFITCFSRKDKFMFGL